MSLSSPMRRLVVLTTIVSFQQAVRGFCVGIDKPDLGELTWSVALPLLLVHWLRADSKRGGYWPCFEYDWFVFLAWPLALPHYLVHTRGMRGIAVFVGFIGLFLLPGLFLFIGYFIGHMS